MNKVVKFGGSSLANAEQFKKVARIIQKDESRRYIIPSAPGKRTPDDTKVTDMLYSCYNLAIMEDEYEEEFEEQLSAIRARYDDIIEGLGLAVDLTEEFKTIRTNFTRKAGRDYAASRGEYLNGILMAAYLGYEFIDAADVIFFDAAGNFDGEKTNAVRPSGRRFPDSTVRCRIRRSRHFQEADPISPDPSLPGPSKRICMRTGPMCRDF